MAFEIDQRVEVYASEGGQHLLLKQTDLSVSRLSRVFKIKPDTLYLEEDVTNHAEFPENGQFILGSLPGAKYKVCGEEQVDGGETPMRPRFTLRPPSTSTGWGQPRPWAAENLSGDQPGLSNALLKKKPKYESCLKRTIPYVSLATDSSGRSICVYSIITNVYIKIPDSHVNTQAILSDVASKISIDENELVLLDSKFVAITDDDDKDIEFWRMPSRRFYVAKVSDFEELQRTVKRKKLSLRKKPAGSTGRFVDLTDEPETDDRRLSKIEDIVKKVAEDITDIKTYTNQTRELTRYFECKICKDIPNQPVLASCCSQIVGCRSCFERCLHNTRSCPLCRTADPQILNVNGYDGLFSQLRSWGNAESTN